MYVALDEPDGVAGVAAVRNSQPSLEDQIIEHQAMGELAVAGLAPPFSLPNFYSAKDMLSLVAEESRNTLSIFSFSFYLSEQ